MKQMNVWGEDNFSTYVYNESKDPDIMLDFVVKMCVRFHYTVRGAMKPFGLVSKERGVTCTLTMVAPLLVD